MEIKDMKMSDVELRMSWETGAPRNCKLQTLIYSDDKGFSLEPTLYDVNNALLKIHMGKFAAIVLRVVDEEYVASQR